MESDIQGADRALNVKFEAGSIQNNYKTEKEGRPIHDDVIFTRIAIPGDNTLEVFRPMTEDDKVRFPREWAIFKNSQNGETFGGTPISELTFLSRAVVENLKGAKFYTVEQLADGADANLRALGMMAGMDPLALRERARNYLKAAKDASFTTSLEAEIKSRDERIAAMEAQMKMLMEQMGEEKEKPKRGRPPKTEAA